VCAVEKTTGGKETNEVAGGTDMYEGRSGVAWRGVRSRRVGKGKMELVVAGERQKGRRGFEAKR